MLPIFSIQGGPAITAAEASGTNVILTSSGLVGGTAYTVTYTGVSGILPGGGEPIADTLTVGFTSPVIPALLSTIQNAHSRHALRRRLRRLPEWN